jgi:hypothetical protein
MGNLSFDASKYMSNGWLKGEDLEEGERTVVTIKAAYEHTFEQSGETRPVLEFMEMEERLTLNKTRVKKLVELFGTDSETWIGQKISLYAIDVNFNGKTMPSVAIARAPVKLSAKKVTPDDVQFMDDTDENS